MIERRIRDQLYWDPDLQFTENTHLFANHYNTRLFKLMT